MSIACAVKQNSGLSRNFVNYESRSTLSALGTHSARSQQIPQTKREQVKLLIAITQVCRMRRQGGPRVPFFNGFVIRTAKWANRAANPAANSRVQQNRLIVATKRTRFEVLTFVHTDGIHITRSGAGVGHDGALSTAPLSPRHPAVYLFVKRKL